MTTTYTEQLTNIRYESDEDNNLVGVVIDVREVRITGTSDELDANSRKISSSKFIQMPVAGHDPEAFVDVSEMSKAERDAAVWLMLPAEDVATLKARVDADITKQITARDVLATADAAGTIPDTGTFQ